MNKLQEHPFRKFEGSIVDNYKRYLDEGIFIGFTNSFPIKEIIAEKTVETLCERFPTKFKIYLAKVSFGKNNEFECRAVVTDKVDISKRLSLGGFGSHCYIDESKIMETAVIHMCEEHDLMICRKICSWPFAKAIVTENHFLN